MQKVLVLALFVALQAHAQWSGDPTVNNPISTAVSYQRNPTIVSDGSGGAIITWWDTRSGDGDIYAQRINASGTVQWTTNGVPISIAANAQEYPTIVSDGAGGAIITWRDWRSTMNWDIYAQRINASGMALWTANGVPISTAAGYQEFPTIVSDGAGGAVITWDDYRSGTSNPDIYAQRINASGMVQWTANGVPISAAANAQEHTSIVSDGAGGATIAWVDGRSGTTNFDIYTQRINASGTVQWTVNGVPISTAANNQEFPTIANDGAGGAIITWQDYRSGATNSDVYAQRINASGTVQWSANGVPISTAVGSQVAPTIVSDSAGGAIITWYDYRNGTTNSDIYAQRINASGTVQWAANGVPVSTAARYQRDPTIVSDGVGGAIITWVDERSGPADMYAQRINASGMVLWTANGVAISTAVGDQLYPTTVSESGGGTIITWEDDRNNLADIYAQRVRGDGSLGGTTGVGNNELGATLFSLDQNYPNPFNPITTIRYAIPVGTLHAISLRVYDVLGREVATLVNETKQPGTYVVRWGASGVVSGVYLCRLQCGACIDVKKMIVLR
jgi:predicted lipoprotein with Yx(FWY)xxD motif